MNPLKRTAFLVLLALLAMLSGSLITGCTVTGHSPWTLDK